MADGPPIELVPEDGVPPPALPGTLVARDDADMAIDAMLADLFIHARNCVRAFGDFHLAVSGVERLEPVLRRLLYDLNFRDFPWARTRVWPTDEACVPEGDPRNRFARLRDIILEHSGIPAEQMHRLHACDPAGPARYEAELRQHLGWREKGHDRLDFVMLDLREDGGIAGLSRGGGRAATGALVERRPAGPGEPDVVTMSLSFMNAARVVAVLATDGACRPALARLAPPLRDAALPAAGLTPLAGELRWYLDREACAAAGRA